MFGPSKTPAIEPDPGAEVPELEGGPLAGAWCRVKGYFVDQAPRFWVAFPPLLALSALLFTRSFETNFIFDEQEAILANPYVNGAQGLDFWSAVRRDFWGLPHDASVGSYRPIPNLVWRLMASAQRGGYELMALLTGRSGQAALSPWLFHWVNVVLHAANGALLTAIVFGATKRRLVAWLSGVIFVGCAVLTEAVSGIVGIADVLGGMAALLALASLRLPRTPMALGVFAATLFGLFSKESAIVCVPLVPLCALVLAPLTHPIRPRRLARFGLSLAATVSALVLYVSLRKLWFPAPIAAELLEPLAEDASLPSRAMRAFLVWYQQPSLPKDALNNPLQLADFPHRVAGALRVYARGLGQVLVPLRLSGDYSFPQEPIPDRLVFRESVLGGLAMVLPPFVALALFLRSLVVERRQRRALGVGVAVADALRRWTTALAPIVAVTLVWVVVSYFPHSNIPTLLPTVRAERFWYFPAIGTSVLLAIAFAWLWEKSRPLLFGLPAVALFAAFFAFQAGKARAHAFDYADDLTFWTATREAVPQSAKAHLNYSVMWGARGRMDVRLESNRRALELAPDWAMANVYMGDTLCRMEKPKEAVPHYLRGFRLAPNDSNLIALALQCLWDQDAIEPNRHRLLALAAELPGTWLSYLVNDIVENGYANEGVAKQYRPRGYNEGPRD